MIKDILVNSLNELTQEKIPSGSYQALRVNLVGTISGDKSIADLFALLPDTELDIQSSNQIQRWIHFKPSLFDKWENYRSGNIKNTVSYDSVSDETTFDLNYFIPFDPFGNNNIWVEGRDNILFRMQPFTNALSGTVRVIGFIGTAPQVYLPSYYYQTIENQGGAFIQDEIYGAGEGMSAMIFTVNGTDTNPYISLETRNGIKITDGYFQDMVVNTNREGRMENFDGDFAVIEFDNAVHYPDLMIRFKSTALSNVGIHLVNRYYTPNRFRRSNSYWKRWKVGVLPKIQQMMREAL